MFFSAISLLEVIVGKREIVLITDIGLLVCGVPLSAHFYRYLHLQQAAMGMSREAQAEEADRLKGKILAGYIVSRYITTSAKQSEGPEPDSQQTPPLMEISQSGKNAKKNRKEKERRIRRKREGKSNLVPPEPKPQSAELHTTESHLAQPHPPEPRYTEPHEVETPSEQNLRLTITSPPPTTPCQTATTTASISRNLRSSVSPVVPLNLHLPKRKSTIMPENTLEAQCPENHQEGNGEELRICNSNAENTLSTAQAATTDMEEAGIAEPDMRANIPPLGCLQGTEHNISSSPAKRDTSSSTQNRATTVENREIAQDGPEMGGSSVVPSSEDAEQTTTASPTAESSRYAEVAAAFDKLSVQSAASEIPASGSREETGIIQAHRSVSAPTEGPAQAPERRRLIAFDTYEWPCRNQECRKLTSPYDGSTVICPRCGPYSKIRYCSKRCLFADVLMHWGVDCGKFPLTQKADPLTIHSRQVSIQPFIPSLTRHDRPERHRQMVRHSLDRTGDYFIFSDWVDWRAQGFPGNWPAINHASGEVLVTINFTDNGSAVPARHFFVRLIRICFLVGAIRTDMAYFLFKMIRGRLNELGLASQDVENCLVWQFKHEFAYAGGFAELLSDEQPVNWPLVAGQIVQLEAQYRSFLFGGAGLGVEWTNRV